MPVWSTAPGGWSQVGLPAGGSGWVSSSALQLANDPYYVIVNLLEQQLTVYRSARPVGIFPAAIGAPDTPTPQLLTFITGDLRADGALAAEAPLVRTLAVQGSAKALAELGPDAVAAIHGWSGEEADPAVWDGSRGLAVTHGCVRLPASAFEEGGVMSVVPNGTPVDIVL